MKKIGKENAIFIAKKMKPEVVFNMAFSEGNSMTQIEIASLIDTGYTPDRPVPVKDVKQAENINSAWDQLLNLCENDQFKVNKETFIELNAICANGENPQPRRFRNIPVRIYGSHYLPPSPHKLDDLFEGMMRSFANNDNLIQTGYDLFLDSARNQFFADGNKRTAQLMMNGHFLTRGFNIVSFASTEDKEYKKKLINFYETNDKKEMYEFLGKCQARTASIGIGKSKSETKRISANCDKSTELSR